MREHFSGHRKGEGGPLAVDEVPERSPASPRTGKLSAKLTDEVPERSEDISRRIEKDLIRSSVRTGAPSPCAGKALRKAAFPALRCPENSSGFR